MAVTADDIKEQIIKQVGDVDPATGAVPSPANRGVIAQNIDLLWDRYAARDLVASGLREQYVTRAAIELVLAIYAPRRFDVGNTAAGLTVKASQVTTALERKLDRCQAEIDRLEGVAALASMGGAFRVGQITKRQPVPAKYPPNPSALRYGGRVRRGRP